MKIAVDQVYENPTRFTGEEPSGILELSDDPTLHLTGGLRYDIEVEAIPGELIVRGTLAISVDFHCSRCGGIFSQEVREPGFEVVLAYTDEHALVDLTDEMRETMILAFPAYPVCRSECRGLCDQCGINRNEATCKCRPPADGRWGVLDRLDMRK